ncbi:hypothetical protein Tco_0942140, partial [Tanacetum coccineum]
VREADDDLELEGSRDALGFADCRDRFFRLSFLWVIIQVEWFMRQGMMFIKGNDLISR